jgi:putative redox protein
MLGFVKDEGRLPDVGGSSCLCFSNLIANDRINAVHLRFENEHVILFLNFPGSVIQMPNKDTKATIHFAGNDFFIGITPSGHAQAIETDSARGAAATPMELLLIALGSCTGIDVISILKKKRQHVTDYRIEVSGERREEFPKSYTRLYVRHILRGRGLSEQAVASAIELSETKYCSVAATLGGGAEIVTSHEILEEDQENGPA